LRIVASMQFGVDGPHTDAPTVGHELWLTRADPRASCEFDRVEALGDGSAGKPRSHEPSAR
jgi:hypothetical protein